MLNRYAAQIEAGNCATWWVCVCCMLTAANGDCGCDSEGHGGDGCVPLSAVPVTADVTLGGPQESHSCGREDDTYFGDCDCERIEFSSWRCDGCGSGLAGERHALFVVFDVRSVVVARADVGKYLDAGEPVYGFSGGKVVPVRGAGDVGLCEMVWVGGSEVG